MGVRKRVTYVYKYLCVYPRTSCGKYEYRCREGVYRERVRQNVPSTTNIGNTPGQIYNCIRIPLRRSTRSLRNGKFEFNARRFSSFFFQSRNKSFSEVSQKNLRVSRGWLNTTHVIPFRAGYSHTRDRTDFICDLIYWETAKLISNGYFEQRKPPDRE